MPSPQLPACLSCDLYRAHLFECALRTLKNTADAEDLIQQIALEALQKSQRIGRIENAESWLWHVYRFAHRDFQRQRARRRKRFGIPLTEHMSSQDLERELIDKEEQAHRERCFQERWPTLTLRQQQVMRRLYVEGRNGKEVAALLGISYKAFRIAKDEALSRLRTT